MKQNAVGINLEEFELDIKGLVDIKVLLVKSVEFDETNQFSQFMEKYAQSE